MLLTVARGCANAEIARDLHVSMSTVKTHLGSLMAEIGGRNPGGDRDLGLRDGPGPRLSRRHRRLSRPG